jgi:dihydrofolate synthase/folylpolyglutamate synthase
MPLPEPNLAGAHQRANAALAAMVVQVLQSQFVVTDVAIHRGITHAIWPARLQRLTRGPLVDGWKGDVVLDGGHNAHAAAAIAEWAKGQKIAMVCGLLKRKSAPDFFKALNGSVSRVACITIPGVADSYPAAELAALARAVGLDAIEADGLLPAAQALAVENTTLLVGGSLVLAGIVLKNHG